MVNKVFRVPVKVYDLSTAELVNATKYFSGQSMTADCWSNQMLKAQKAGSRLAYSNEWSSVQRHYPKGSEQELKLVDTAAWTGTVLDFNDETLKEGITLNEDGEIASAKTTLGKKNGIVLPHKSAYVKDLDDKHMPLVSYLHGVKEPKRELPDYAYLHAEPNGIKPVFRGGWDVYVRDNRWVNVFAAYGSANVEFAAWQVDEARPKNVITPQEYSTRKAELNLLNALLEDTTVLVD